MGRLRLKELQLQSGGFRHVSLHLSSLSLSHIVYHNHALAALYF